MSSRASLSLRRLILTALFVLVLCVVAVGAVMFTAFRIPSDAMAPTLEFGDQILVNKFSYGVRLPVTGYKIIDMGSVQRGDVIVFRYPVEPDQDYIKRVVGLPGEEVAYIDKQLFINGKLVAHDPDGSYYDPDRKILQSQYDEHLDGVDHKIFLNENRMNPLAPIWRFDGIERCEYLPNGVRCTVPPGHYFVLGDNRDNSLDSRYWGFVPEGNILGKALSIWMNFDNFQRIGRIH